MTELQKERLIEKIVKLVKNSTYRHVASYGINAQQVQKIRAGQKVLFRAATLERLRKRFEKTA